MHRAALILFLYALAPPALAHPNHAGGSPLGAGLLHLLTEPDHLAMILLPFAVAAVIVAALRHRRARREKTKPARRRARLR